MRMTTYKPKFQIRDRQRGAVLLLVTFSLIAFLGLAALALDLGRMYIIKSQLQNAADAGALRAALELNGTSEGILRAGDPGTPCKSGSADPCGIEAALENAHLLAADDLLAGEVTVQVAKSPTGEWIDPDDAEAPYDYYYAKVTTRKEGIASFFAGVLGIWENAARAVAIAGRYSPQGEVMPIFIPIVRRNSDQLNGLADFPDYSDCGGRIYDDKEKGEEYNKTCPGFVDVAGDTDKNWRGPDTSGNWGFLRPGEVGCLVGATDPECNKQTFVSSSNDTAKERGGTYVIRPNPNADKECRDPDNPGEKIPCWLWKPEAAGTSWTGNFGYFASDPEDATQKSIQEAVCRGKAAVPNSQVPGCRRLHPGGMSTRQFAEAFNTRFDQYPKPCPPEKIICPDPCPPDADVRTYDPPRTDDPSTPPSELYSAYIDYKGSLDLNYPALSYPQRFTPEPPPSGRSGSERRRLIRLYIIDNAWLTGYSDDNDPPSNCRDPLQGINRPGHIVGCAEFFIWTPAPAAEGLVYAEFVRRIPDEECKAGAGPATYTEIRLFR